MKNFANGKTAIKGEVERFRKCHRFNESSLISTVRERRNLI